MRVIAGTARRLNLVTPEGNETRPTSDRIKETLFNMLAPDLPGCVFIDIFAGSGQMGIEALSRGAKKAYFIDSNSVAAECIKKNLKTTHLEDKGYVIKQDASGGIFNIYEKSADIIFMDPPYMSNSENSLLGSLKNMHYVNEDTVIIVEAEIHKNFDFVRDLGYDIIKEKLYKTNKHVFMRIGGES